MPTLSDIANALGINKTTVSKALNHSSDISHATRERVLAEAERIGYVKHRYKKTADRESAMIGIICPEVNSHYYAQIVTYLNNHLQEKGYGTLLTLSDFSADAERRQLERLMRLNVSGVIIITEQTDLSDAIHSIPGTERLPIVIMGLNYASRERDVVSIDEASGINDVVNHLVRSGHRRIAFLGDQLVSKRLLAMQRALQASGIPLPEEYICLNQYRNEECGYLGMQKLLQLETPPTAVMAGYDAIALGAYRALAEKGLRIPEDMAVAGFDDSHFCQYLPISLTSVCCDVSAECRVAIAILLGRINDPKSQFVQTAAIVPRLIVRESTAGESFPAQN